MISLINYKQTEVVMADNNTENVTDLSNIAAYNDYDESGESDLEDLNGEERTDMLTETIVIVVVKKILEATISTRDFLPQIV